MRIIAIDPGERHCGVAVFTRDGDLVETHDFSPSSLYRYLEIEPEYLADEVVFEEFRLYVWKMQEQGMKEMKTSEVIGVIKYICEQRGVPWHQQQATIKKPTEGIIKGLGLNNPGKNIHERDAVLHGYHWLLRNTDLLERIRHDRKVQRER